MRIIFGIHAVESYLREFGANNIVELYICSNKRNERLKLIQELCNNNMVAIDKTYDDLTRMCNGGNHQGVVVKIDDVKNITVKLEDVLVSIADNKNSIILVLDGITDNHNLGAIIRTAECFGVSAIILPKDNSANPDNSIVNKVSCGAINYIPVVMVTNISRTLDLLKDKGYWIVGTTLSERSTSLFDYKVDDRVVMVLGSEDKGIRRLVAENCDYLLTIPMQGKIQSLNVSVATGVALSYLRYQYQK